MDAADDSNGVNPAFTQHVDDLRDERAARPAGHVSSALGRPMRVDCPAARTMPTISDTPEWSHGGPLCYDGDRPAVS